MKTYKDRLKDPRWEEKRLKILDRDQYACQYCFVVEDWPKNSIQLEVHHFEYSNFSINPWDVTDFDLITLCSTCHDMVMQSHHRDAVITAERERQRMERRGELRSIYSATVQRGETAELDRERDSARQLEIASVCTCEHCLQEQSTNKWEILALEIKTMRERRIL